MCTPTGRNFSKKKKLNQSLKVNQKYIRRIDNQRPRRKCIEWRVKLFQGIFEDFKIGLKFLIKFDKIKGKKSIHH